MIRYYVLGPDGETPVPEPDVLAWAGWFERADRTVALDFIQTPGGEVTVSTVFLGLDHNFSDGGPPLLWETMVFGGEYDGHQVRNFTRAAAIASHGEAVRAVVGEAGDTGEG